MPIGINGLTYDWETTVPASQASNSVQFDNWGAKVYSVTDTFVTQNDLKAAIDKICKLIEERTTIKIETSEILELLKE